jgi:hypothetical protein
VDEPEVLGMKRARVKTVDAGSATTYAGLSLMSAAFAWWVTYYSQWGGFLGHLDMKLSCVSGDSFECTNFQQFIGPSVLPAYSPLLLWLGVVVTILGLFLTRWNKA